MLFVIAGHGGIDPGATQGKYKEHDLVVAVAEKMKEYGKSKVSLFDTSIDHYTNKTLANAQIGENDAVLEIHMDAYSDSSAKGGHVIINSRFGPDKYDLNLVQFCKDYLPGRSEQLVKRSDLYNCNVCANRGINYRLLECGFITNPGDCSWVYENPGYIAKELLRAFDIEPEEDKPKEQRSVSKVGMDSGGELTVTYSDGSTEKLIGCCNLELSVN